MASLALAATLLALPGSAAAAGCEVLIDPRDRTECVARASARDAARAEVDRRVAGGGSMAVAVAEDAPTAGRSAAWQQALDEADGVHPGDVLEPRPIAAIIGLAWFGLVMRHRLRARRRTAS